MVFEGTSAPSVTNNSIGQGSELVTASAHNADTGGCGGIRFSSAEDMAVSLRDYIYRGSGG